MENQEVENISLENVLSELGFTDEETYNLSTIMVGNKPLFSHTEILYDVVGYILENKKKRDERLNNILDHFGVNGVFDTSIFNSAKTNYFKELDNSMNTLIIQEGLYTCGNCKSKKTIHVTKQIRAADEPPTVFITCVVCKHKWREN